jgi:cytochrome c oxidase cbb3-type subunit 2
MAAPAASAQAMPAHMAALRKVGVPYTDQEIAAATQEVQGKSDMDALIAYLQAMGRALK